MNFLSPAEVTLYEVYMGREEVEQTLLPPFRVFLLAVHLGGVHHRL